MQFLIGHHLEGKATSANTMASAVHEICLSLYYCYCVSTTNTWHCGLQQGQIILPDPGPWGLIIQHWGAWWGLIGFPLHNLCPCLKCFVWDAGGGAPGCKRRCIHSYIFMEGRVKSILLCLGDEELDTSSPKNTHTPSPITFRFHGVFIHRVLWCSSWKDPHGITCPKLKGVNGVKRKQRSSICSSVSSVGSSVYGKLFSGSNSNISNGGLNNSLDNFLLMEATLFPSDSQAL